MVEASESKPRRDEFRVLLVLIFIQKSMEGLQNHRVKQNSPQWFTLTGNCVLLKGTPIEMISDAKKNFLDIATKYFSFLPQEIFPFHKNFFRSARKKYFAKKNLSA